MKKVFFPDRVHKYLKSHFIHYRYTITAHDANGYASASELRIDSVNQKEIDAFIKYLNRYPVSNVACTIII